MHPRIDRILASGGTQYTLWDHKDLPGPIRSPRDFAEAIRFDHARIAKTLFLQGNGGSNSGLFCLVVSPSNRRSDLREPAHHLNVSRLRLASLPDIDEQLNYPAAGISPLACGEISVIIDSALLQYPTICIGAGVVGEHIEIAPADIIELTGAKVMDLKLMPCFRGGTVS